MTVLGIDGLRRCFGGQAGKEQYGLYHDIIWAKPISDDIQLFEALVLETMHSGLSFEIILRKKDAFRELFFLEDPMKCAQLSDTYLEECLTNPRIVRHRKKVFSIRQNARVFISLQKEFGSFYHYLFSYVNFQPITHDISKFEELPKNEPISYALSNDLKKRGMSFVGQTTIYAYMQAIGMVNDHLRECHCKKN